MNRRDLSNIKASLGQTVVTKLKKSQNSSIRDYVQLKKIGQGSFGSVYLCQDKRNDKLCVMKSIGKLN